MAAATYLVYVTATAGVLLNANDKSVYVQDQYTKYKFLYITNIFYFHIKNLTSNSLFHPVGIFRESSRIKINLNQLMC